MTSRKRRLAIAAAGSSAAGSAAGLIAAHFGMDPMEAARLGIVVVGGTGNLLQQMLGVPDENSPDETVIPAQRIQSSEPGTDRLAAYRESRHSRHRQLHRGAQRSVRRIHGRGSQEGDRHGAA